MIVYLDTSVVLSRLLGQANALSSWGDWKQAFTSVLTRVEFLRTIDRLRLEGQIDDPERVALHRQFSILWEAAHRIPLSTSLSWTGPLIRFPPCSELSTPCIWPALL